MIESRQPHARPRTPVSGGQTTSGGDVVGAAEDVFRRRLWLIICCLALTVLAFVTRPGNIIADTKIDLAVNPFGFLDRALQLWDPAQFGQLQDQAVGYFFPVGPFFALGKLMALPPWVVQRLWITGLLLAAFLGVTRLTARLGIGTPATQAAAGLAYALAPRALGLLGVLSSEFLPAAMLPWILIPLVRVVRHGPELGPWGRVRAVAQSAVAVALCSGTNAASVVAVLIPAGIYLLTAPRPAMRWRILGLWAGAVILATWWWLYALLLLDRYGVSPLTYTESAMTTTSVTSLFNALRGTEDWVTYLTVNGQPWWPVGFKISTSTPLTVLTALTAGLGIKGLLRRGLPYQRFLLCSLLAGVLIILTGYVSGLGNPLAVSLDHLLNGPLAALRNLRKFDPMIRLPVAVGLADVLARARVPRVRMALALAVATAIAGVAAPAYFMGLSQAGDFRSIPAYWTQATNWLNKHAGNQAVLAVPGAAFGEYTWGRPMDDVLEAMFTGNWASRQLTYIGSVGETRLLDAIDEQMAAGIGSTGLTQTLARMGVKYLVVRNDLLRSDLLGAWPARIQDAIASSPGIVRVASFGGLSAGSMFPDDAVDSFDTPYPPVEIYQVQSGQPVVSEVPTAQTLRVYGGPEALMTLGDLGLLKDRPVLLDDDSPRLPTARSVLTDSLRRRVRNFGELRTDYSPTLTASQPASTFEAADDYLLPGWEKYLSVAQYGGIATVVASSSDADIDAIPAQSATGLLPFSAVDGDLRTMWESGSLAGPVGQWIKVGFLHPMDLGVIHVAFVVNDVIGPPVTAVTITTQRGQLTEPVLVTGSFQAIRVPAGPTAWLKLTIARTEPGPTLGRQVGISEISMPGVDATRAIVAPNVAIPGGGDPSAIVLAKAEPQPTGCMRTSVRWVCSDALVKPTEEQYGFDHSFSAAVPARATLTGTAVLTDGAVADKYLLFGRQPEVSASSTYTPDPQDQAVSAFDGNPATSWVSGSSDSHPRLEINWRKLRTVSRITITRPPGAAGPLQVLVVGSTGQTRGTLANSPVVHMTFRPMRTSRLTFYFTPATLPLQITDVSIGGVPQLKLAGGQEAFRLPCGLGPKLTFDGVTVPTSVSGTFADVADEQPVSFSACSPVRIRSGVNSVVEPDWDAFDVQSVALDRTGSAGLASLPPATPRSVQVLDWTDATRKFRVDASQPEYLVVDQNFNAGWQAALAGRRLTAVQLDGWKQAYLLPAGSQGIVTMTFEPDVSYRRNLFGGFVALGFVLLVAITPARRRRRRAPGPPAAAPSQAEPTRDQPAQDQPAQDQSPVLVPIARTRSAPHAIGAGALGLIGIGLLSAAGLWIGGYPGSIILPLTTLIFVGAVAMQGSSGICRELARPWLVLGLLLAAVGLDVAGQHLSQYGSVDAAARALSNTAPQVLCMVIIARLIAALITSARAFDSQMSATLDEGRMSATPDEGHG